MHSNSNIRLLPRFVSPENLELFKFISNILAVRIFLFLVLFKFAHVTTCTPHVHLMAQILDSILFIHVHRCTRRILSFYERLIM